MTMKIHVAVFWAMSP